VPYKIALLCDSHHPNRAATQAGGSSGAAVLRSFQVTGRHAMSKLARMPEEPFRTCRARSCDAPPRRRSPWAVLAVASLSMACEPKVVVGDWACNTAVLPTAEDGGVIAAPLDWVVPFPWKADFEDGFCGYASARGFCYGDPDAEYVLVRDEARSGHFAAAFTINTDDAVVGKQTRCVREGVMPEAAYYGAWFKLPSDVTSVTYWNLMHFVGGDGDELRGLWDVTVTETDGVLDLRVFDYIGNSNLGPNDSAPVPLGEWIHIQFYLKRSAAAEGEMALYLNGEEVVRRTNILTDDSIWGQWYVGNLAYALTPSDATIYLDDVSISDTL
jgi:Polysaccharide lyase